MLSNFKAFVKRDSKLFVNCNPLDICIVKQNKQTMVHTRVNAKNDWIDPELIQRASFLYTFFLCFFILMNSHNFNNRSRQLLSKHNIAKIEAKSQSMVNMGIKSPMATNQKVKDSEN
jgi:hypothetical protein